MWEERCADFFLFSVLSDQLNSFYVRASCSEQLWRCKTSAGVEAAVVPQPGTDAFSETPLLHLWRQILWWEGTLHTILMSPWKQSGHFLTGLTFPSFPSCHILQASTMVFTAVRAVKASLSGQCARIWPIPVGTIKTALWTKDKGTAASTAVTRSAWPWGWRGKVSIEHTAAPWLWSRIKSVCFQNSLESLRVLLLVHSMGLVWKLGMSQACFCPKLILILIFSVCPYWFYPQSNILVIH